MSRYLLLVLLNLPFIIAALIGALTQYKLGRISKYRFALQLSLWTVLAAGLIFAQAIYQWLFSNNLTKTEPLSLFDVVQITAIIVILYIANRTRSRLDILEQRIRNLHEELSIKLSQ